MIASIPQLAPFRTLAHYHHFTNPNACLPSLCGIISNTSHPLSSTTTTMARAALPIVLATAVYCWAVCASAKGAHHGHASAPAPGPGVEDCSTALLSLADCLTFVEEGSKEAKPQGGCCSGLKKVVKHHVACLCQAFAGSADFGVKLNMTKALTLPDECGVKTPPFSKCHIAAGAPETAPVLSPAAAAAPQLSPTIGQSTTGVPAPAPMHSAAGSLPKGALIFLTSAAALFSAHLWVIVV